MKDADIWVPNRIRSMGILKTVKLKTAKLKTANLRTANLKTANLRKILLILGILILPLLMGVSIAPAENKTPPYTGWKPAKPFQPFEKSSPQPKKISVKAVAAVENPVETQSTEMKRDTGEYRTEEYLVREGDWIAKILREKGVLKENNLPKLMGILRKFNQSMTDFNLIRPGEKIVILVKVTPGEKSETPAPKEKQPSLKIRPPVPSGQHPKPLARRLKFDPYRIKQGDVLSQVVRHRYDLTVKTFTTEYLDLFKKCNPSVKNPNRIFPGQTVNLPLYPPQWYETPASTPEQPPIMRDLAQSNRVWLPNPTPVPNPIKPVRMEPSSTPAAQTTAKVAQKAWAPEKEAPPKALPLAPLSSERTDAGSSWQEQQAGRSVAEGLGDILPKMGEKWIHSGEHFIPMKSGGHINLKAETYPIVKLHGGTTLIVDLYNSLPSRIGRVIKSSWGSYRIVHLSPGDDLKSAFSKILKAFQYPKVFKKGEPLKLSGTIPVSITGDWIAIPPKNHSGKPFEFVAINLLNLTARGKERVIDLSGLDSEIVALLKERGISVLSLSKEKNPLSMASKTLKFLGWQHKMGPHTVSTASHDKKNIKLTLSGVIFFTEGGSSVFMTALDLPPEVALFLYEKGFRVVTLSPFSTGADAQHRWGG